MTQKKETRKDQRRRRRRNRLQTVLIVLVMLVGAGFLAYPSVADYWNRMTQSRSIMTYNAAVADIDPEVYKKMLADAKEYNRRLAEREFIWTLSDEQREEYMSLLDYTGSGIMGYIEIEKIDLQLPIYHGTGNEVLRTSIGHLEQTSLPVGAYSYDETSGTPAAPDGSHCALSGHRGLPSARLFTDLDQLVVGDVFTLTILNETYTYQVDQINIVEPSDVSLLHIEPGKDYCTLITCTPYSVNTHRLLVRGVRVGTDVMSLYTYRAQANATLIRPVIVAPVLAIPILPILFFLAMFAPHKQKRDFEQLLEELESEEELENY